MPDLSRMTERQSVPGALLNDINLNLVRDHIDTAIKRRGYDGPTEPEEYLIEHGCLLRNDDGTLTPTLAGIVAFGREPHRHVSLCGIDIAQFSGPQPNTTDLVLSRQIRGDLLSIIDRAIDLLWARTEHRTHIAGTERVEEHAYPLVVLRELRVHKCIISPRSSPRRRASSRAPAVLSRRAGRRRAGRRRAEALGYGYEGRLRGLGKLFFYEP